MVFLYLRYRSIFHFMLEQATTFLICSVAKHLQFALKHKMKNYHFDCEGIITEQFK